jgi:hypothetical protein
MTQKSEIPLLERLFISPGETERVLGLGHTKISDLIADGTLASRKEGARRLVSVASVKRYADAMQPTPDQLTHERHTDDSPVRPEETDTFLGSAACTDVPSRKRAQKRVPS